MKRICLPLGTIAANCYVLTDEKSKTACVIDPGLCTQELLEAIGENNLEYILLTHGHFDHIFGVNGLKERFPDADVCVHADDEICLHDRKYCLADDFDIPAGVSEINADIILHDGDIIGFADTEFEVLHTPGHSKGSVCYVDRNNKTIFSGDTLFCLTVGRTDMLGGDYDEMMSSIKKLAEFDDEYEICTGHNRSTTIGFERKRNRYMRKL